MAKKISIETFNKVTSGRFVYNKGFKQLGMENDLASDTVAAMCVTLELLRDGKIDELMEKMKRKHFSDSIIRLAAEALKINIPANVEQAMEARRSMDLAKRIAKKLEPKTPAEETEKKDPSAPAQAPALRMTGGDGAAESVPTVKGNDALYFIRILEELHQQNELLRDLLDVVIPKYVGDMKDNVNANCDAMSGILKDQGQQLEAIRCQIRKRGL